MGVWGEYDDENDNVADMWIGIEESTLPKSFNETKEGLGDDYSMINTIRATYAKNNPNKIYNGIKLWLPKYKKQMKDYEDDENPYMNISGIALKAARFLQDLPSSDPLSSGIFNSMIPNELPRGYPEWLRKEALNAINNQIARNQTDWRDDKKRKAALQHELFYFSKGNQGREGAHPRKITGKVGRKGTRKLSKRGSMRGSRKGTRKSSRQSVRKGPSISATSVKVNTIKKGNDGNTWIVKSFNTKYGNVQRWVKQ